MTFTDQLKVTLRFYIYCLLVGVPIVGIISLIYGDDVGLQMMPYIMFPTVLVFAYLFKDRGVF